MGGKGKSCWIGKVGLRWRVTSRVARGQRGGERRGGGECGLIVWTCMLLRKCTWGEKVESTFEVGC
jgi:hypothetical protein